MSWSISCFCWSLTSLVRVADHPRQSVYSISPLLSVSFTCCQLSSLSALLKPQTQFTQCQIVLNSWNICPWTCLDQLSAWFWLGLWLVDFRCSLCPFCLSDLSEYLDFGFWILSVCLAQTWLFDFALAIGFYGLCLCPSHLVNLPAWNQTVVLWTGILFLFHSQSYLMVSHLAYS